MPARLVTSVREPGRLWLQELQILKPQKLPSYLTSPHSAWTHVFPLFWASRLDASTQQSTRGQTTPRHPCDARSYPGCSAPLPKRAWRYPVPSPSGKRSEERRVGKE